MKYKIPEILPCPECGDSVLSRLMSEMRYGQRTPYFATYCIECVVKNGAFVSRSRYKHVSVKRWNDYALALPNVAKQIEDYNERKQK